MTSAKSLDPLPWPCFRIIHFQGGQSSWMVYVYQSSLHKSYIPLTTFLQKKTNFSWYNLWSFRFVTLSFDIKICSHLAFQLHQYGATHSLNPEIFYHRIFPFWPLGWNLNPLSTKCGLIHYKLLRILFFWLNWVMNNLILGLPNSLKKFINLKTGRLNKQE